MVHAAGRGGTVGVCHEEIFGGDGRHGKLGSVMDNVRTIGSIVGKEPPGVVFLIVYVSVENRIPFGTSSVVDFGGGGRCRHL